MSRPKTITDEELLSVARKVFREAGHAASTRQIAESAGISEGILYQRFRSKDDLFFAAMEPPAPDLQAILGPDEPTADVQRYLRGVVARMAAYFGEVVPLGLRLMMHPSFDRNSLTRLSSATQKLEDELARRLRWFAKHKQLRRSAVQVTARMIVSLAHDWAVGQAMSSSGGSANLSQLQPVVDVICSGAASMGPRAKTR